MYLLMCNLVNETKTPQQLPFLSSLLAVSKRNLKQQINQKDTTCLADLLILFRSKSLMEMTLDIPYRSIYQVPEILTSMRANYKWISWKLNPVSLDKLTQYRREQLVLHDRYRKGFVKPECELGVINGKPVTVSNGSVITLIDEGRFRESCEAFDTMLGGGFKESQSKCVSFGYVSDDGLICLVHMLSKCPVEFPNHVQSFKDNAKTAWEVVKEILTVSIPYFIEPVNKEIAMFLEGNISMIDFESWCNLVKLCQFLNDERFCESLAKIYLSRNDFDLSSGVDFDMSLFGASIEDVLNSATRKLLGIDNKYDGGLESGHYVHDRESGGNSPGPCRFVN